MVDASKLVLVNGIGTTALIDGRRFVGAVIGDVKEEIACLGVMK